jgi:hypothetical protein
MPLAKQTTVIPFARGQDEKSGKLAIPTGALELALDVEFDRSGELNIRRGYQAAVAGSVGIRSQYGTVAKADPLWFGCAVRGVGEVVILGWDFLVSLAEPATTGHPVFIQRNPVSRCSLAFFDPIAGVATNTEVEVSDP